LCCFYFIKLQVYTLRQALLRRSSTREWDRRGI
jgi:hypothetical protein